jgi:tetratricopeptide (TPR) repeat protein
LIGLKRLNEAMDAIEAALAIDVLDAGLYAARGDVLLAQGEPRKALADFSQAIKLRWNFAYAYERRAVARRTLGDLELALDDYDQAIKHDAKRAEAFIGRCWTRAVADKAVALAAADCNTALRLKAGNAEALESRCFVRYRLGEFAAAIGDCDAALKADASRAGALYLRGLAKRASGDAGGSADITKAKAQRGDVASEFAAYGVTS